MKMEDAIPKELEEAIAKIKAELNFGNDLFPSICEVMKAVQTLLRLAKGKDPTFLIVRREHLDYLNDPSRFDKTVTSFVDAVLAENTYREEIMMNWKQFFEEYGSEITNARHGLYGYKSPTIESIYHAFKERMISEMKVEGIIDCGCKKTDHLGGTLFNFCKDHNWLKFNKDKTNE